MPFHFKVLLSVLIVLVCCTLFYYDHTHGGGIEKWVALALGPIMVFGIWVFPEANSKQIRSDINQKR
jgi:hypothetical protein